ncbi:fam-e protein [Plasmodium gallinaceum]|uniref:Fam-e protein n=1 Tax=Plasmodium gallinaceum TaxID=5849 RepID=A0A1J1GPI0_PLAGA|nr:fam-e protein [Plasmodium gallinaceum]CRG94407.1 fam-e protein [Plasmodium gallinaceum]
MAFLNNDGCEDSEGDFTKCFMTICEIQQKKFEASYCRIESPVVDIKKTLNNNLNDLSKNLFTYEFTPANFHSRIIILSNNDKDGILLLYEYNPNHNKYPDKTYLCRLRNINQKLTLCESINIEYFGRSLTFKSYDIFNEENKKNNMISIENPNHKIIKSKYDEFIFKEHYCHPMKTKYISYCNKRYTICKKMNNDQLHCSDANYSGNLIILDNINFPVLKRDYVYLPSGCLKENLNPVCTPYICTSRGFDKYFECKYEEISVITNIRPINNIMPKKNIMPIKDMRSINEILPCNNLIPCKHIMPHKHMLPPNNLMLMKDIRSTKNIGSNSKNPLAISLNHEDIYHENRLSNAELFAMSFMSFLVLFTFFFCLIYRIFRKKRSKYI